MEEILRTREMIQKGADHIHESGTLSLEEAAALNQAKGNLYGALAAAHEAARLFGLAQADFSKAANLNRKLVNEIHEGCDTFESIGLEGAPDNISTMVYDLTASADAVHILADTWERLGSQLGELGRACASYSFDTSANGLNQNIITLNDYGNRVAQIHIATADEWRGSI